MIRARWLIASILATASGVASAGDEAITTRNGWFADQQCATVGTAGGKTAPPGRTCTQECIRKGVPVVFFDEKTKTLLRVSNPAITRDQECNRVAVTGTIDEKAKTIRVATIKILEPYVAKCDVK